MNTTFTISIVVMVVIVIILATTTYFIDRSNSKKSEVMTLNPFSGRLAPPNLGGSYIVDSSRNNVGVGKTPEDGLYLVGMAGGKTTDSPQISCPIGTKINVIGAYVEVDDPYGECGSLSNPVLQATCGYVPDMSKMSACGTDKDCAEGFECSAGRCMPKTCSNNSDCTSTDGSACPIPNGQTCSTNSDCEPGVSCVGGTCSQINPGAQSCNACIDPSTGKMVTSGTGKCATFPTCNNVVEGKNTTCVSGKCKPRDASAWLSNHCNGKNTCLATPQDKWIPSKVGGQFGPLPCKIPALSTSEEYASLPMTTGWGGGTPTGGSKPQASTYNQGYYVHGVYTCVPE